MAQLTLISNQLKTTISHNHSDKQEITILRFKKKSYKKVQINIYESNQNENKCIISSN